MQESGEPYYTKMIIHHLHVTAILCVLQHIGFHQSRLLDISKRSVLYLE